MIVLSIETSCDDTGISIIEVKDSKTKVIFSVLANFVSSQTAIHSPYGGVFPALAKREHIKNLPILLEKALKKAKIKIDDLDLICVTSGPGLEPALWTGIVFAKELSKKYKIPITAVNHMEGHILSVFAKSKNFEIPKEASKVGFPMISLLVSGGHTELVLVEAWGKYKILGQTLDDAVGEAFDKVARMLGLPYPGGPEISKLAEENRKIVNLRTLAQADEPSRAIFQQKNMRGEKIHNLPIFTLPRPMMYSKDFNFSYSGLKTAVLYLIKKIDVLDENTKKAIALEFENAAIEPLLHKTKKAIEKYNAKTLIVGGGVAQNKHLQRILKKEIKKTKIFFPVRALASDNALMIGIAGTLSYLKKKKSSKNVKAEGNLSL